MSGQIEQDKKRYTVGYGESQIKLMQERSIEKHGKFIQPYLKVGAKILDCGCGPGTMSIGMAKAVFPGEVVAIDVSEEQLAIGRDLASKEQVTNISFELASIYELPFADNTFDLVFSQAVLDHLDRPLDAILEQKRVTKKGGVVAAHSGNFSRKILYPTNEVLEEAINLRWQSITENGGNFDRGLELGELFYQAGLKDLHFTMFCDNRDVALFALPFAAEVFDFPYFKKLLAAKKITREKLQSFREAWEDFAKIPYAYYGMLWGECIGTKS